MDDGRTFTGLFQVDPGKTPREIDYLSVTGKESRQEGIYRLAEDKNPPQVSLGTEEATRKKCRDAWAAWWRDHADKVDLARPRVGHVLDEADLGQHDQDDDHLEPHLPRFHRRARGRARAAHPWLLVVAVPERTTPRWRW